MKQKIYSSVLTLLFFFNIFGILGQPAAAQTFCQFSITSFEAQNTSATDYSTVNKNSSVKVFVKSSFDQVCVKPYTVVYTFQLKTKSGYTTVQTKEFTPPINTSTHDFNFIYDLSSFSGWNNLSDNAKLEYSLTASGKSGAVSRPFANTNTWGKFLNVTGSSTGGTTPSGTGNLSMQLAVDKAEALTGSTLYVDIKVNGTVTDPLAIQKKYKILTYVNTKWVGQFRDLTSTQLTQSKTQEIVVNTENGFKAGANTIRVEAYNQDTNTLIAQASLNISMPGASSNSSPTVSVSPTKSSYALGETITLQFQNLPSGRVGVITINNAVDKTLPQQNNFPIELSTTNGFNDKSNNNILIKISDSSGAPVTLDKSSLTIPIGIQGAQTNSSSTPGTTGGIPTLSETLVNPLPWDGLLETFLGITKGLLAGLAIWAVIAIIIAGFRMVLAAGNEEAIATAKRSITWAILGLVVAILSFSIVAIVQNLLNVKIEQYDPRPVTGYEQTQEPKNLS
ncbi:MAG: hypothetical protein JNN11_01245 [Candidatus Doudnabacteria bacterium]|nr:hypothetical protein [Candidatus Doudnabacteria bacterium]